MNKIFKIIVSIAVAFMLITIIKPYVDDYNDHQQYDFRVNTLDGEVTKDTFKGKALAIYFGYTYCPDVCPTSLSSLAQALHDMPKDISNEVAGLFISVDPSRDTLKNLKAYSKYFHPNFIGGTSTEDNIAKIAAQYGVHYKKVELENSAMDYSVAHSSSIYIFDKDGRFREKIDHFSNPTKIKESLINILK